MFFKMTQRRGNRAFVLLAMTLLLAACSTTAINQYAQKQLSPSIQQHINHHQKKLNALQHWQLSGALSLHVDKHGVSLFMNWQQDNRHDATLRFTGPVNTGSAVLHFKAQHVSLSTSQGKHYQARSADQLLARVMGWHLPVNHLFYWIRGLAAPNVASTRHYTLSGQLKNIVQDGWQIHYQRYKSLSHNIMLPSKLILTHAKRHITVKIIVNRWRL